MITRVRSATGTPRVSVVVPCYNYGQYLVDCVQSILSQPHVIPDVLILDDASTDGSGDLAESLAEGNSAVNVIRHKQNKGHIATYNEGLGIVEGEFVVLISADDLLTPGALGRATALMTSHPSVGVVYGNPVVFSGVPPRDTASKVASWSVWPGPKWAELQCRRAQSLIYSPETVVRTSVQREVGDYRPELPHSGDLEMWLRIAAIADVGRVNGPDQALKRVHDANMITTLYATALADLWERRKAYEYFFDGSGRSLANVDELRKLAWRRMAIEALEWASEQVVAGAGNESDQAAAVAFAADLDPGYRRLGAWREFELRSQGRAPTSLVTRAQLGAPAAARNLRRRLLWHRWHRFGT